MDPDELQDGNRIMKEMDSIRSEIEMIYDNYKERIKAHALEHAQVFSDDNVNRYLFFSSAGIVHGQVWCKDGPFGERPDGEPTFTFVVDPVKISTEEEIDPAFNEQLEIYMEQKRIALLNSAYGDWKK